MFLFADSSIAYFTSASFLPLLKCRIAAATHAVASVILLIRVACLLIRVACLLSSSLPAYYSTVPLTYVRTCCRTAPLSITGLLLVRVADLPSFSSLAYCSYVPLAYPHFRYTTFVRVVELRCYALLLHFYLHCTFCLLPFSAPVADLYFAPIFGTLNFVS